MAINFDTFFARAGRALFAANAVVTAAGTTVPAEAEDFTQELGGSLPLSLEQARELVRQTVDSFQAAGATAISGLARTTLEALLVETVKADNRQPDTSLTTAIAEAIKQMTAQAETLDASTPAGTVAYGGSNVGNGVVLVSTNRGDGRQQEHTLAEDLEGTVSIAPLSGLAELGIVGEESVSRLHPTWPKGSGTVASFTSHTAASGSNLVANGTFETENTSATELPEGWIAPVATLGTTLKMTNVEVQTVTISGTPTGGYYLLHYTNASSKIQTTVPLAYNASGSTVQAALRALTGLENITVATTGTPPDYVHTITFTDVTNPSQLTSTSALTGGTPGIAHATTTAASAFVMRGARALEFDSNASELTAIETPLNLTAATPYAFCLWSAVDVVPAAGVITVDLIDGVSGSVIADDQGVSNSFTFNASALTTTFAAKTAFFRTPSQLPAITHLRIRISTAVSSGTSVFVDEVCMVAATRAYPGGPYLAAFTGPVKWESSDTFRVAMTNDRAGAIHEWLNRIFDLADSETLFPTNNSGAETIDDALIA